MIPDKAPARKRPYLILPASAPGLANATVHGPEDEANFSLRFAFRAASATVVGVPAVEREPVAPTLGETTGAEKQPRRAGSLLDGLAFAVLLSVIGSTAGYYLAGQWTADSLTWSVVGGTAGLVLGGSLLLWIRRTR